MIQRKIPFASTILTLKTIALENVLAGEVNALIRGIDVPVQPNHGWHRIRLCYASDLMPVGGAHHLTLVKINKDKSPFHRANHQWAIVLIEYQNTTIHPEKIAQSFGPGNAFRATGESCELNGGCR